MFDATTIIISFIKQGIQETKKQRLLLRCFPTKSLFSSNMRERS